MQEIVRVATDVRFRATKDTTWPGLVGVSGSIPECEIWAAPNVVGGTAIVESFGL